MLRCATMVLLLWTGCDHDEPKASPRRAPLATPDEPVPRDAGTPLAPAAVFSDMALIPRRESVDAFYLDLTEVTVRDYAECVKRGACGTPTTAPGCDGLENNFANKRSLHPVNCVTDVDAWKYCRFRDKRLPTGMELTAATSDEGGGMYPWGAADPTCAQAVLAGCGDSGTSPVGSKPGGRSRQGVSDLVGNVAEIEGAPGEPYDSVVRYQPGLAFSTGGSYATTHQNAVVGGPDAPSPQVGFRCASSLPGKPQIGRY